MMPHIYCSYGPQAIVPSYFQPLLKSGPFSAGVSHEGTYQPLAFSFPNGDFLVFMGYAYDRNFRLLRASEDFSDFVARLRRRSASLHDQYDGSYIAVLYEAETQRLFLASDRVGLRFLYIVYRNGTAHICTRMSDLAKNLSLECDPVGILQYSTLRYCLADRTFFRNCHRIPPGFIGTLDNGSLVGEAHLPYHLNAQEPVNEEKVEKLYDFHTKIASAFKPYADKCSLALSSGWDSRLILSGIMDCGYSVDTFTTGTPGDYEVGLTQRIATAAECPWTLIDITNNHFPEPDDFYRIVDDCEAGQHVRWHAAHSHVQRFAFVFLGDLFEAFQVRAPSLATKEARIRYSLRSYLGLRSIDRLSDSDAWFDNQAVSIVNQLLQAHAAVGKEDAPTRPRVDESDLREAIHEDVDVMRQWASRSSFPTVASIEEFWHYSLKVRFVHGDQLRQLSSSGATAAAIATTAWIAEATTAIDVRDKLNNKLRYKVNRHSPHRGLRAIPSYDTPWVSADWPNFLRNAIQATRSLTDDYLSMRHARNRRSREMVFKHFPLTTQMLADREKVRRFSHQETYEMKSWLRWLDDIDAGKRRAFEPTYYLDMATILHLLRANASK